MKKSSFRMILTLAILTLVLTACAGGAATQGGAETPAAGAGGDTSGATPGSGAAGGDTAATQPAGAGASGAATNCVGVDTQQLVATGQTVYNESCAGCHGDQAQGTGSFPALAGNAEITGADVAGVVQSYLAVDAHPKDITPDNLAAVLSYVRGSFGNTGTVICPADVSIPAAQ